MCVKVGERAQCKCRDGFRLAKNEKTCEKVHPCEIKNGGCTQICVKHGDEAKCKCNEGWKLVNNQTCVKVHPCDKQDNGGCSDKCVKNNGEEEEEEEDTEGYTCACDVGRKLLRDGKTCTPSKSRSWLTIGLHIRIY